MLKQLWGMFIAKARGIPMIKCDEVLDQLFEYLDGEIDEERRAAIDAHLDMCKKCYPRAQFERTFLDALAGVNAGETVPDEVRANVLAALESEPG